MTEERPKVIQLDIPTREEHAREVKKLWTMCIVMASLVFLAASSSVAALLANGHPWSDIVNIAVTIFDIVVLSYGMGFFVPAFLTSLKKMSLAIEMSRIGVEVGLKTAQMIEETRKEIEPMTKKIESTASRVEKMVKRFEERDFDKVEEAIQKLPDTMERIAVDIKKMRERVDKQTEPIPIRQRPTLKRMPTPGDDNGE